jgi:hypothetical protein
MHELRTMFLHFRATDKSFKSIDLIGVACLLVGWPVLVQLISLFLEEVFLRIIRLSTS